MQVALNKPDLEEFVTEQVKIGHYPSPEAVIEAAVAELRDASVDDADVVIDDETAAAINLADEQADRGEGLELDAFRARMQKRFAGR